MINDGRFSEAWQYENGGGHDQTEMIPENIAGFGGRAPDGVLLKTTLFTDE